jgi:CubicO group peptidase (beta-lactamase class C family)
VAAAGGAARDPPPAPLRFEVDVGPSCIRRAPVPADLDAITTIRRAAEVPPRDLGLASDAATRVWEAVQRVYRSGIHPAMQLCVRHRGAVLVDRAIGWAQGGGPDDPPGTPRVLCTPETPFVTLSASKAVTAMLVHLLDERNLLRLDDPVCEYVPEFGCHGKEWITIRHLLIHRAGIPNLPRSVMQLDTLKRPDDVLRILCETRPTWRPGRELAYHAVTGGFVLGEVMRRVTGDDPRALLDEALRRPLRATWLTYGVAPEDVGTVARNHRTGLPLVGPVDFLFERVLGVPFHTAVEMSNDPRFLTAVVPAANVVATADEMSRFYQVLLDGGRWGEVHLLDPRTVRRATSEQSYLEFDFTLGLPFRYGMGFMLGAEWFSLYGPYTRHAFGHLGFTNIVCWADPERRLAVALLTSGKPFLYPELIDMFRLLREIGLVGPREPGRGPGGWTRGGFAS